MWKWGQFKIDIKKDLYRPARFHSGTVSTANSGGFHTDRCHNPDPRYPALQHVDLQYRYFRAWTDRKHLSLCLASITVSQACHHSDYCLNFHFDQIYQFSDSDHWFFRGVSIFEERFRWGPVWDSTKPDTRSHSPRLRRPLPKVPNFSAMSYQKISKHKP